ncbi:MAG TPA: hypothetical protein VGK48_26920 [Terriglobia bacterium]
MSHDDLLNSASADEAAAAKESSSRWDKKSLRKLFMIPLVVGVVVAGVAFGLPLVFATKKEPREVPPESTIPDQKRNGEI